MGHPLIAGRTALVSGAGNGIGRAVAVALAREGARPVLVGRTVAALETVAAEIGPSARTAVCDVSDAASVASLGAELAGEDISILVNNAGVAGPTAPLTEVSTEDWDAVFAVNVRGVFLMCRQFLPVMVARGRGDVINVASVSGKRPLALRTPYAASKMAVIGLTTTLAQEVGPAGVMVNTLSPGPVDGARMRRNFALTADQTGRSAADAHDDFVSRAALKRMVTEEEVGLTAVAMLTMPGLCGADIDLSAGMVAR